MRDSADIFEFKSNRPDVGVHHYLQAIEMAVENNQTWYRNWATANLLNQLAIHKHPEFVGIRKIFSDYKNYQD